MIRFPRHIERQYASRLLRRLKTARGLVEERLSDRRDASQEELDRAAFIQRIRTLIRATEQAFSITLPIRVQSLLPLAVETDSFTTRAITRMVTKVVAVDIDEDIRVGQRNSAQMRDLHREWAQENAKLIKSMEADTFDDLSKFVVESVRQGTTDLGRVISARFGVAENRARLIARDQIGSLNGKITEARQTDLGITSYEWSSSQDQRVRPVHRRLNGVVRKWSDPHPTERHPGAPIACRCVAIPVMDLD